MIVADLETLDYDAVFADEAPFDTVIAADVLEHLRDPWVCLKSLRALMRPDGALVVSIPNIAHNAVIAQLLAGRFPYRDQGLLDRTHLRFFTRQDVEELLTDCGFLPEYWDRNLTPESRSEFSQAWQRLPEAVREALQDNPDGRTYQFIVRARPSTEAGWVSRTRADMERLRETHEHLGRRHQEALANLAEHQKAFAEAQVLLADKEKALTEYAQAFAQARDSLGERERRLDEVNKAFGEAREIIGRLQGDLSDARRAGLMGLLRRLTGRA